MPCPVKGITHTINAYLNVLRVNYDSMLRPHDRAMAINRMKDMGVILTTSESAVFELMRTADHPNFRTIQRLLKEVNEMDNEFASSNSP